MTDPITPTVETPADNAPRAWTDPVCTEYAVGELTQATQSAGSDFGIFS